MLDRDKTPLEGFSFTLSESEAAAVFLMLKEEGFEDSSQGVKAFLLAAADADDEATSDEDDEMPSDLSEKLRRIIEAAESHPEVTGYAIKKGSQFLASLLRRMK